MGGVTIWRYLASETQAHWLRFLNPSVRCRAKDGSLPWSPTVRREGAGQVALGVGSGLSVCLGRSTVEGMVGIGNA